MRKFLTLLIFASVLALDLHASPADSLVFRADDQGLWHLEDNPALIASATSPDGLMMGVSYDAMDGSGAALSPGEFGNLKAAGLFPLLGYYGLNFEQSSFDLVLGSGIGLGKAFAFGWDFTWSSVQNLFTSYELGLILRPASFLSLGLTEGLDAGGAYEGGIGLALRPLALTGDVGPRSRALTLNADASLSESGVFSFDNVGARFLLSDLADLRAWLAPPAGDPSAPLDGWSIGLELRLALGPTGFTARTPSISASSPAWRVGEDLDFRLSDVLSRSSTLPSLSHGRRVLVVKDLDEIDIVPVQGPNPLAFLSSKKTMTFTELLALLEKARLDGNVEALAFEDLPSLHGAADYEEFIAELSALKKAGKKVYFYGDSFDIEYDLFASVADGITLNPLGSLGPKGLGLGFHRAYFKPLFDRLGVRFVNLAPWDTKSAYNSFSDASMPPAEEAMMRRFYSDIQDQLALSLSSGRGARLVGGIDAAMEDGPYLQASEALKAGLVDSVAYAGEFEDSLRKAFPESTLVSGLGDSRDESWGRPAFRRRAAIVWLSGDIGLGKGRAGRDIGSDASLELERLRKDRSVAGIILRVDSPGGAVLTSDLIAREVRLAVKAGKPVVVSMGHYAASGGYYLSAPASWIVAEPMTITGSIGVTGLVPNIAQTLRKLGIAYDGFDLAPGASFLDPGKALDEDELAKNKEMIFSIYDRFVEVVAAGRKMDPEAVRKIGEGKIYSGREALKLGLVDELGGLAEAKAWIETKLGARLAYVDVIPGESSLFPALVPIAAAVKTSLSQGDDETLGTILGPVAERLRDLLALGQGPLYYLDTKEIGF